MNTESATPVVPVILSGGAGTRLWPLSRETAPKPFMPLPDGETLLAKTAHRATSLAGVTGLVTVTNRDYYFRTKDVYAGLGANEPRDAIYLLEPFGRNTAPAVALAAMLVQARYGTGAVMLVLAADHLIRDEHSFGAAVAIAARLAREGRLVTFGITPTHPETGYGYIECGKAIADRAFAATRYVEKPPLEEARDYIAAGNYVWNSGMFAFTAGSILASFARHAPTVLEALRPVWQALAAKSGEAALEIDAATFAAAPDISIDFAVMEHAAANGNVAVVRGEFDWSDVGSWQAISALSDADDHGNRGSGRRVAIDTRDTFVHSEDRVVATIGIENLVIVDTRDAVLVAHKGQLQRVKEVVAELKARGHDSLQAAQDRFAASGHLHSSRRRTRFQDEATRGEARRVPFAAITSPPQRALGGRARYRVRHLRRAHLRRTPGRVDVRSRWDASPDREPRNGNAGDHRSGVWRLHRGRRHRPLR